MKRGLVIGKFMPLHKGHLALIEFAAKQCDELIVSMTYRNTDPIPGSVRYEWLREEFLSNPKIKPEISLDDFDDETATIEQRITRWIPFLKVRFAAFDTIFSSEEYGGLLANRLGIRHVPFDPNRTKFPVSSSLIRKWPLRYWDFIANSAKPYFLRKICFYGPESTGKSTLAKRLAEKYHTEFVPEVSREIITSNEFTLDDIVRIGHAQTDRVMEKSKTANKLLFCDTDLITTQIYCRHYLGEVPAVLFELEKKVHYDKYFLFGIDVPWVADGVRDLGERRVEMLGVFKKELEMRGIEFEVLAGSYEERENEIILEMEKLLD